MVYIFKQLLPAFIFQLVLIEQDAKQQWKQTLMQRWAGRLRDMLASASSSNSDKAAFPNRTVEDVLAQVLWMPPLKPEEYLAMLRLGDLMIDPFPFGGGVTTLEAVSQCTPVITLPSRQTVHQLAAGMINRLGLGAHRSDLLIARDIAEFLESARKILGQSPHEQEVLREELCRSKSRLYDFNATSETHEWRQMLLRLAPGRLHY